MGNFGYMCNSCGLSVRGGEKAVLRHVRHGLVLSEARGTYDGYGRVEEIDSINRDEAWRSEFLLEDSIGFIVEARIWQGKPISWVDFRRVAPAAGIPDLSKKMYNTWETLPRYKDTRTEPARSGIEAWHAYCFDRAAAAARDAHTISKSDPNQSWGTPRKKYL
jgi:hypothetical protein